MTLCTLDCFGPIPSYMLGAYEIAHIRAIVTAVSNGNTDVLIKNLISMLKPGGYLQWDESDGLARVVSSKGLDVSKSSCEHLIDHYTYRLAKSSKENREYVLSPRNIANLCSPCRWVFTLPSLLTAYDTTLVHWTDQEHLVPKPLLIKPWTEDALIAMMEFASLAPESVPEGEGEGFLTKEMWGMKINEAASDAEDSISMYFPMVEVVVWKN